MKRLIAITIITALLLTGCGSVGESSASDEKETTIYSMDTVMNIKAYGSGASAALAAASDEINRLDKLLSRQDENSPITALNRAASDDSVPNSVDVGDEICLVLDEAREYNSATGGAFDVTVAPIMDLWDFTGDDPRVPAQSEIDALLPLVDASKIECSDGMASLGDGQAVDLGGIAKGYASDRLAAIWDELDIKSAIASLGGNVYARGTKTDGSLWRVAVKDPEDPDNSVIGILSCADSYVITSGGYQRYFEQDGVRYHHILDPKTGYSAESGLTSVTIIASSTVDGNGAMCDALSTALFVMGEDKAVDFWRSGKYDFDMILVTDDGRILVTDGISGNFDTSEAQGKYEVSTLEK
ncbi:FAD:protein FMN transferase [bioreactor metagenome]|uniref:FAD:protein FMN transferase n=1 Tax=bioreactor metagenome TaxID=1076179 RepID=A0A645AUW8_9ZZZZ